MKAAISKVTTRSEPASASRSEPAGPSASSASPTPERSALGHHLSVASSSAPVQLQRRRKRWTPAQQAQSDRFWAKKNARVAARQESQARFELNQRKRRELASVSGARLVQGPTGAPMPNRTQPLVAPDPGANVGYSGLVERIGDFLHPQHPVRSVFNEGGPQFIQQFNDGQHDVTRRVGVDVEPSSHVRKLKPHLNLQTQHDGAIQGGALADPHLPLADTDPFPRVLPPHHPLQGQPNPLHGLRPEERRKFIERYLGSRGIPLTRG